MLLPGSRSNERGAGQDAGARGDPLAPAACVAGLLGPACCALRRAVARESHDTGCSAWGCVPCACGVPRIASASLQDWPLTSVLPPLLPARPGVCQFSGQCESLALSGADGRVRLFDTGASAPRSTGSRRRRGLAALDTALDRRGRPACSNKSPAARSTPVCGAAMLFPRPGLTPAPACALPTHAAGTGRLQLQLSTGGAALAVTPDAAGDAAALSCTSLTWLPVAHSGKVCHSLSPDACLARAARPQQPRAPLSGLPWAKAERLGWVHTRVSAAPVNFQAEQALCKLLQGAAPVLGERRQPPLCGGAQLRGPQRVVAHPPSPSCHHTTW